MDAHVKEALWRQFGAAIDMLDNAIAACPEEVWCDGSRSVEPWYLAYHTLFYLDLYLSPGLDGFAPPPPFTLDELKPDVLPERPYTKAELRAYLEHGRRKCRETIAALTAEEARRPSGFDWLPMPRLEVHLYSLRHVQHGAGQLNLMLRQAVDAAPRWVKRAAEPLGEEE